MKHLIFAFLSLFFVHAFASDFVRVDQDLTAFDLRIAQRKADFSTVPAMPLSKSWVQEKLQFMFEIDQDMRRSWSMPFENHYSPEETSYFTKQFLLRSQEIDNDNTADLQEMMKVFPWFTISEFGKVADNQAWLIVQHADRHPEFQQQILSLLETLYPKGETDAKNYAYLHDRVMISWFAPEKRRPQRYGTQGSCVAPGTWQPLPMEDAANVDQRRASVGLGPIAEYIASFAKNGLCP